MILWLFFILGQIFVTWKRALLSAQSKLTPWKSIIGYLVANGAQISLNFLLSTGLFLSVWRDTSFLTHALLYWGVSKDVEIPLNPFTAALYGIVSSNLMDIVVARLLKFVGSKDPTQNDAMEASNGK